MSHPEACLRRNFRRVRCGYLVVALACGTTSYADRGADVRQAFLQLDERQVLSCLGPPSDFDYPDEHIAIWAYTYPSSSSRGLGLRGIDAVPRLDRRTREFLNHPLDSELPPGFCSHTIVMVSGKVTDLRAEARSAAGLNRNAECARTARMCVE